MKKSIYLAFALLVPCTSSAEFGAAGHLGWSLSTGSLPGVKTASPYYGFEATFGVEDFLQFGPYFDRNTLYFDTGLSGFINAFGLLVRAEVASIKALMFDFRLGLAVSSNKDGATSDTAFSFGAAVGYRLFQKGGFTIKPRIGFRSAPFSIGTSSTGHFLIDLDLLLGFNF